MEIKDHLLVGDHIKFVPTPNVSGKFAPNLPDTIVMHYTAGASASSSVISLTNKRSKASAHLVIGRDGSITQLAPFDIVTWHAGQSVFNGRSGLNKYSIGIELDNAGLLTKVDAGYLSWFGTVYPEDEVFYGKHKNKDEFDYWHSYTEVQLETAKNVVEQLRQEYGIEIILGHDDIAPERKFDPGPAFPMENFKPIIKQEIIKEELEEVQEPLEQNIGVVSASALNVRKGPGTSFERLSQPILNGTEVSILEEEQDWVKVSFIQEGWVSKKYINKQ